MYICIFYNCQCLDSVSFFVATPILFSNSRMVNQIHQKTPEAMNWACAEPEDMGRVMMTIDGFSA